MKKTGRMTPTVSVLIIAVMVASLFGFASAGFAEEPVEMEMFINHTWWTPSEWTGKVADFVAEKTGVRIKATIAADDRQLALLVASGDLPELIYADSDWVKRLSNENLCYDWNSLIEQYAPDFTIDPVRLGINTQSNGKAYTILNYFSTKEEWESSPLAFSANNGGMALRKDLLEQLGNPEINTMDDLYKVLGMAKAAFPDIVPMIMATNWRGAYIKGQVGAYDQFNLSEDGKVVYSIQTPQTREYYTIMNKFYRAGYLISDNYTFTNEDEALQYADNDQCFAYMDSVEVGEELNTRARLLGKDFLWTQLTKSLTPDTKYHNTSAGWSGIFITKNNKNPDKAIKFCQYMSSDEGMKTALWGIEGEDWVMNSEGYPEFNYDIEDFDATVRLGVGLWGIFEDNAVVESLGTYNPNRTEFLAAAAEAKAKTVYLPALGLLKPDADSDDLTIKTKLDDMITNQEVKVILAKSEEEFDTEYENMLNLAEQIGLSSLLDWANAKYAEVALLLPD